jgi:hypothetical protein
LVLDILQHASGNIVLVVGGDHVSPIFALLLFVVVIIIIIPSPKKFLQLTIKSPTTIQHCTLNTNPTTLPQIAAFYLGHTIQLNPRGALHVLTQIVDGDVDADIEWRRAGGEAAKEEKPAAQRLLHRACLTPEIGGTVGAGAGRFGDAGLSCGFCARRIDALTRVGGSLH